MARKRNWGIEDEQRERDWMQEEREYDRQRGRLKAEDDYDFEKMMRQRRIDQEDEDRTYERQRQEMLDKDQLEANRSQRQMQNLETAVKLQMIQDAQDQQHEQQMATIKFNEQVNRDNMFANMTPEQIRAVQLSHLSSEAQVAMANSYSKDGEAELLRQQALASEERFAKDKENLMNFAKEMVGMIKDTATGVNDSQKQQIDQLRADNQRMAERVDHTQDQALNAVGNVAASAASNLHISHVQADIKSGQSVQQPELIECECYQCHQIIRIAPGTPQCPNCGAPFAWE